MIVLNVSEKRKYSVFVEKKDIKKIIEFNLFAPSALFIPFINGLDTITEENQYDFIEYKDSEIILFLSRQTWILNYNDFCNFSVEELLILKSQTIVKIEDLKKILKCSDKTLNERKSMAVEIEKYNYLLDSILYFEKIKEGKISSELLSNLGNKSNK